MLYKWFGGFSCFDWKCLFSFDFFFLVSSCFFFWSRLFFFACVFFFFVAVFFFFVWVFFFFGFSFFFLVAIFFLVDWNLFCAVQSSQGQEAGPSLPIGLFEFEWHCDSDTVTSVACGPISRLSLVRFGHGWSRSDRAGVPDALPSRGSVRVHQGGQQVVSGRISAAPGPFWTRLVSFWPGGSAGVISGQVVSGWSAGGQRPYLGCPWSVLDTVGLLLTGWECRSHFFFLKNFLFISVMATTEY